MTHKSCDCTFPLARKDRDGDVVCQRCKRVLRVGPLGLNGIGFGGIQSYKSPALGSVPIALRKRLEEREGIRNVGLRGEHLREDEAAEY